MNPNPQPYAPNQQPPKQSRFSSKQLTLIIVVVVIFGSCSLCAIIGVISNYFNPKSNSNANAPFSRATPATASNANAAPANANAASTGEGGYKYFDGSRACQFLSSVDGLTLGNYAKGKASGAYLCAGGSRRIKLSCSPVADTLCDEVSYEASGEEKGATRAELGYTGLSLHAESNKKDIQTFVQHCDQLARQALGAETTAEMKQYIQDTGRALPINPAPDSATLERHAMVKSLGTGFVKILTRKNTLPGGTVYFIYFTVYPDEHWVIK